MVVCKTPRTIRLKVFFSDEQNRPEITEFVRRKLNVEIRGVSAEFVILDGKSIDTVNR